MPVDTLHKPWRHVCCYLLLCMCIALATGFSSAAAAAGMSRQQAVDRALATVGGDSKVLGVRETTNEAGEKIFAVKVLTNGRVRVIRISASGG